MTIGQVLAILALVITGVMLWVARQARLVHEDIHANRIAMETSDRVKEQRARRTCRARFSRTRC